MTDNVMIFLNIVSWLAGAVFMFLAVFVGVTWLYEKIFPKSAPLWVKEAEEWANSDPNHHGHTEE